MDLVFNFENSLLRAISQSSLFSLLDQGAFCIVRIGPRPRTIITMPGMSASLTATRTTTTRTMGNSSVVSGVEASSFSF